MFAYYSIDVRVSMDEKDFGICELPVRGTSQLRGLSILMMGKLLYIRAPCLDSGIYGKTAEAKPS